MLSDDVPHDRFLASLVVIPAHDLRRVLRTDHETQHPSGTMVKIPQLRNIHATYPPHRSEDGRAKQRPIR